MAVDRKLLEILCDPVTKVPVKRLPKPKLKLLNDYIEQGGVLYLSGGQVKEPLQDALITDNDTTIYRVVDGIPVMLEDQGISTVQFSDF